MGETERASGVPRLASGRRARRVVALHSSATAAISVRVSSSSPLSTALKEMPELRRLVSGAGSISVAPRCQPFHRAFGDFDVDRRLGERGVEALTGALSSSRQLTFAAIWAPIHLMASNASSPAKEMDLLRAVLGRTANLFSGALSALFAGDFGVTSCQFDQGRRRHQDERRHAQRRLSVLSQRRSNDRRRAVHAVFKTLLFVN